MSKKQHPIRKMGRQVFGKYDWSFLDDDERRESDKILARHIKPLIRALEFHVKPHNTGIPIVGRAGEFCRCPTCRLLAEWKAPLT